MRYWLYIFLVIVSGSLLSCSPKTYFTSAVRKKVENKELDIKKLQYFIDSDIELTREVKSDTAKVSSGRVLFSNGKFIQIINLKAQTRGVCTNAYPNRINVAFEDGDNKFLTFIKPRFETGSETDAYELYTSDDSNPNIFISNNNNNTTTRTISYDGNQYNITIKGRTPRLMIMKSEVNKKDTKRRNMKGRKVNDDEKSN